MLSYDLYFLWSNLASVLLFLVHFIPKARWESGHRLSYYPFDLCISVHSASWAWSRNVYFFPPCGTSREWKEVTARQYARSEGTTGDHICFSSIGQYMDSICHWNNVAHLYCPYSLWSSKHFMGTLINPKGLLWARYLAAFVLTLWPAVSRNLLVQVFAKCSKNNQWG